MSQQTDRIKRAIIQLSSTEKQEIKEFIEKYEKGSLNEQKQFSDSLEKSLGPIASGLGRCTMCGK